MSPYSDLFGGAILNATISLYAHAAIEPLAGNKVIFESADRREQLSYDAVFPLPLDGNLDILKGVVNRVAKDYGLPGGFRLTTFVDAPPGSGLGTSSTLVVAVLGAFAEWLKLPLGEYDMAHLAFVIEREDLQQAGGKQDQYAATFGGVNFMEFYKDDKVIVNPLRIKDKYLHELENNLVLYYTSTSRLSSSIISEQQKNVKEKKDASIEAMHHLKEQAVMMKEALLRGAIDRIGEILDFGFQHKKNMAKGISNSQLDDIYEAAKRAGATGGKISGAGGGGFMIFYCPQNTRHAVITALEAFGGNVKRYHFTGHGVQTWSI